MNNERAHLKTFSVKYQEQQFFYVSSSIISLVLILFPQRMEEWCVQIKQVEAVKLYRFRSKCQTPLEGVV